MKIEKDIREKQGVYAVHVGDYVLYIGSGKLGDRITGNISKLQRGVHANKQLQDAYNKIQNVRVEVIDVCKNRTEARNLENIYIDYYKKIDGVIVTNKYNAYVINKKYEIKLNKEKVEEIRELIKQGKRNKDIAKIYNVDPSVISRIKTGKRWANINKNKDRKNKNKEVECTGIQTASSANISA